MATVEVVTSDRILALEAETVVNGSVNVEGDLILTKHGGSTVNAGHVVGPTGDPSIFLADANAYTDQAELDANAYSDVKLVEAKTYADQAEADAKAYSDAALSARVPMAEVYAPISPITNFAITGQFVIDYLPSGKKRLTSHLKLERGTSNYGTLSTSSWLALGTIVPVGARITTPGNVYINGWITTSAGKLPINVYLDPTAGGVSIQGVIGLTTSLSINDFITIFVVVIES